MQHYISTAVSGIVDEIKQFGKLTVVKLSQGNYYAECKLGNGIVAPIIGTAVTFKGTTKLASYEGDFGLKYGLEFWANEVVS
jgi:hypothetical protein